VSGEENLDQAWRSEPPTLAFFGRLRQAFGAIVQAAADLVPLVQLYFA
jgi:hypothetical protein